MFDHYPSTKIPLTKKFVVRAKSVKKVSNENLNEKYVYLFPPL